MKKQSVYLLNFNFKLPLTFATIIAILFACVYFIELLFFKMASMFFVYAVFVKKKLNIFYGPDYWGKNHFSVKSACIKKDCISLN